MSTQFLFVIGVLFLTFLCRFVAAAGLPTFYSDTATPFSVFSTWAEADSDNTQTDFLVRSASVSSNREVSATCPLCEANQIQMAFNNFTKHYDFTAEPLAGLPLSTFLSVVAELVVTPRYRTHHALHFKITQPSLVYAAGFEHLGSTFFVVHSQPVFRAQALCRTIFGRTGKLLSPLDEGLRNLTGFGLSWISTHNTGSELVDDDDDSSTVASSSGCYIPTGCSLRDSFDSALPYAIYYDDGRGSIMQVSDTAVAPFVCAYRGSEKHMLRATVEWARFRPLPFQSKPGLSAVTPGFFDTPTLCVNSSHTGNPVVVPYGLGLACFDVNTDINEVMWRHSWNGEGYSDWATVGDSAGNSVTPSSVVAAWGSLPSGRAVCLVTAGSSYVVYEYLSGAWLLTTLAADSECGSPMGATFPYLTIQVVNDSTVVQGEDSDHSLCLLKLDVNTHVWSALSSGSLTNLFPSHFGRYLFASDNFTLYGIGFNSSNDTSALALMYTGSGLALQSSLPQAVSTFPPTEDPMLGVTAEGAAHACLADMYQEDPYHHRRLSLIFNGWKTIGLGDLGSVLRACGEKPFDEGGGFRGQYVPSTLTRSTPCVTGGYLRTLCGGNVAAPMEPLAPRRCYGSGTTDMSAGFPASVTDTPTMVPVAPSTDDSSTDAVAISIPSEGVHVYSHGNCVMMLSDSGGSVTRDNAAQSCWRDPSPAIRTATLCGHDLRCHSFEIQTGTPLSTCTITYNNGTSSVALADLLCAETGTATQFEAIAISPCVATLLIGTSGGTVVRVLVKHCDGPTGDVGFVSLFFSNSTTIIADFDPSRRLEAAHVGHGVIHVCYPASGSTRKQGLLLDYGAFHDMGLTDAAVCEEAGLAIGIGSMEPIDTLPHITSTIKNAILRSAFKRVEECCRV